MAAYAQFGYGGYPSASQLLSANAAQSPQTGGSETPAGPQPNPPTLSPTGPDCRSAVAAGGGDVSSGALSPDAMSQNSNTAGPVGGGGVAAAVIGAVGGPLDGSALGHAAATGTGSSCCENGRPIITDPVSGQTVCSCQYDTARLALSSYSRLPAASVGVYGAPYPSTDQNPYQSIGVDSSAFYSPLSNPYALKDSTTGTEMTAWTSAGLQPTTGYYSYDPMSAYGYGASYDLAARRKNATRESTATLKAWLNEHKKNPYPTKGEKIMLAIITKMTLTQVSTWFANARRRLKKENKMTWEPKNRTDDDDDAMVSDDEKEKEDLEPEKPSQVSSAHGSGGGTRSGLSVISADHRKEQEKDGDDLTDDDHKPPNHTSDMRGGSLSFPGGGYHGVGGASNHPHGYHPYHHQHPAYYQHQQAMLAASYHSGNNLNNNNNNHTSNNNNNSNNNKNESNDPKNQLSRDCGVPIPATKPKIWSLADTVACKTPPPTEAAAAAAAYMGQHQTHQQHQSMQQHMTGNRSYMQMQQQQQQHQQQQQAQQPHIPQHMMSSFGAAPYSRGPTTAYGGFLGGTAQQLHTTNNIPYNSNSNNTTTSNNTTNINSSIGIHTPIIPTTTNQSSTQQPPAHLRQPSHPSHAASQRGMGFPEAQPDTPPQTPPNMKVQSVAANLLLTASQAPMTATCRSSSALSHGMNGIGGSGAPYNTSSYALRFGNYSPRDDSSSGSSCSSGSPQLLLQSGETPFKPLFRNQPLTAAGFVSPASN